MSYLPTGNYQQDLGASASGAWDVIKNIGSGALDVYREKAIQEGRASAFKEAAESRPGSTTVVKPLPSWVIPAAVGGGVLLLVMLTKNK